MFEALFDDAQVCSGSLRRRRRTRVVARLDPSAKSRTSRFRRSGSALG